MSFIRPGVKYIIYIYIYVLEYSNWTTINKKDAKFEGCVPTAHALQKNLRDDHDPDHNHNHYDNHDHDHDDSLGHDHDYDHDPDHNHDHDHNHDQTITMTITMSMTITMTMTMAGFYCRIFNVKQVIK